MSVPFIRISVVSLQPAMTLKEATVAHAMMVFLEMASIALVQQIFSV